MCPLSEKERSGALRSLPSVDRALQFEGIQALLTPYLRGEVITSVRDALSRWRSVLLSPPGVDNSEHRVLTESSPEELLLKLQEEVESSLSGSPATSLKPAINCTGVILHTNMGRAVMADSALEAIRQVSCTYSLLEMDQQSGKRSKRDVHVNPLFCELTGAEAVTFVNNNAGATLIILDTLAKGKEVILSRGEMVEIGGSFRIPDVMEKSGAKLVGVGTTNRTHLADFENAITENTGAILQVHPSNYRVIGFTKTVELEELVALGKKHGIPVVSDVGSGCLADLRPAGLDEPLLETILAVGADLVCFSTDKLLGGPQGGGVAGKKEMVERVRKNPLARALRMDKLRLSALEATLRLYRNAEVARERIPTVRMILTPASEIKERAEALAAQIAATVPKLRVEVRQDASNIGGGSVPEQDLPSWVVALQSEEIPSEELSHSLRLSDPPIIARIHREEILMDLRTVLPGQEETIVGSLQNIL